MKDDLRVVIPAGGKSSRSGLAYPKTLYRLRGTPILIRILEIVSEYDKAPIIIINPAHEELFKEVLKEFSKEAEIVFQVEPKGMGNAVLQASSHLDPNAQVILIWSDIPLFEKTTLKHLIDCHITCKNDFSFVTSSSDNCYTIVERQNGKVIEVKETKALGIPPAKSGERDTGIFIFRKQNVFEILSKDEHSAERGKEVEHGFLYTISKLVKLGSRVEGYPIALPQDVLSFNTPEDLELIQKNMASDE